MHHKCTAPGCKKSLPLKAMWLAEVRALQAANGDQRVEVADFPKFALCGRCGHLLRKEGVRVYRYLDSVEFERKREERLVAQAEDQRLAAARERLGYGKRNGRRRSFGRDGRNVGGGLSRFRNVDAKKRAKSDDETPSA